MTPTPELEAAVERLKEALDDFDRDLQDVIDDEAFNVGQDESIEVSTADLRLVLASLPTGDMASRDHAPGEQRQAETETPSPPAAWLVKHKTTGREDLRFGPLADLPFNRKHWEQWPLYREMDTGEQS